MTDAIVDIRNYHGLGPAIGTAGQPTEAQLRTVAAAGFSTVINLGLLDPKYCLPDEAGLCAGLGVRYHHVPVDFAAPTLENFRAFAAAADAWLAQRKPNAALDDPGQADKLFVHCAANYRVSAFFSLWGEQRLGWTRDVAEQHARRFWEPNPVWSTFLRDARVTLFGA